jgi:hypothetical protein
MRGGAVVCVCVRKTRRALETRFYGRKCCAVHSRLVVGISIQCPCCPSKRGLHNYECAVYMCVASVYIAMCFGIYCLSESHIHTYIHTYMHAYMHTCMQTYMYTYMHTYIHIYIHTYTHILALKNRERLRMLSHAYQNLYKHSVTPPGTEGRRTHHDFGSNTDILTDGDGNHLYTSQHASGNNRNVRGHDRGQAHSGKYDENDADDDKAQRSRSNHASGANGNGVNSSNQLLYNTACAPLSKRSRGQQTDSSLFQSLRGVDGYRKDAPRLSAGIVRAVSPPVVLSVRAYACIMIHTRAPARESAYAYTCHDRSVHAPLRRQVHVHVHDEHVPAFQKMN